MSEIQISAVRARGAGGQNVNKVASAIHLQFDAWRSTALPDAAKLRLQNMQDRRITDAGIIVIKSQAYRSQQRNRQAALQRLVEILRASLRAPKKRKKTRPGKAAKQKRLDDKARRAKTKQMRRPPL